MLSLEGLSGQVLQALAGASLRAVVMAACAGLCVWLFRVKSAPVRHAVWALVAGGMLLLPVVSQVMPAVAVPRVLRLARVPLPNRAVRLNPPTPRRVYRPEPISMEVTSDGRVTSSEPMAAPSVGWRSALVPIYLLGVLVMLLRMATGMFLAQRIVGRALVLRGTPANEALEELAEPLGLPYPWPEIYESSEVKAPLVAGSQAPVILLPPRWREWDAWKLRAVIAHELTHTRRRDALFVVVAALNKAVYWFHPLAWWLDRRIANLCEQATDDAAVLMMGDAVRYARIVLDIAVETGRCRGRWAGPFAAPSMAGVTNTSRRIHRLLEEGTSSSGMISRRGWTGLALVAATLIAALGAASAQEPARKPLPGDVTAVWSRTGWQAEAIATTAEDAQRLEERLASNPDDLATRAKLIAYYHYNANFQPFFRHAMWVAEQHPESELAGSEPVASGYEWATNIARVDPFYTEPWERLWRLQAQAHGGDSRVLGNAARALRQRDPAEAELLYLRARELDPESVKWLEQLAQFYAEAIRKDWIRRFGLNGFVSMDPGEAAFDSAAGEHVGRSQDGRLVARTGQFLARTARGRFVVSGREAESVQAQQSMAQSAATLLGRAYDDAAQ